MKVVPLIVLHVSSVPIQTVRALKSGSYKLY